MMSGNLTGGKGGMNVEEIEDLAIELLARRAGREPEDLRRDLEERGSDLPIDSLLLVEIVAEVQKRCGVVIPPTPANAFNLRSVRRFAELVHGLIEQSRLEAARRVGEGA
jgi:acyl carrier protein